MDSQANAILNCGALQTSRAADHAFAFDRRIGLDHAQPFIGCTGKALVTRGGFESALRPMEYLQAGARRHPGSVLDAMDGIYKLSAAAAWPVRKTRKINGYTPILFPDKSVCPEWR